ncbi:unnamed protein product [Soboliphyme baturini]|uniref:AA_permease domain-containing protein n=1 Tax=Soboliphyme baturini TaxID=241478 RepID=A0A183ILT9_9BILA|nr:unnamed protein product [Soboliphyme baturini]
MVDGGMMDLRIIALITTVMLCVILFIGISFESKTQSVMLVVLVVSLIDYLIGTFLPPSVEDQARGVTGYSWQTLKQNFFPDWRDENFFSVFAVFFPAVTGFMAGANISGDLNEPQKAIPKGTLLALLVTTLLYFCVAVVTASTCLRDATGNVFDLFNGTIVCNSTENCPYGLIHYYQILELEGAWGPLITAGILAATLSSALAGFVAAPKVFQAVCKDNLFPYISWFGKGFGKDEEPRRAYVLTFVLTVGLVLIGRVMMLMFSNDK